MTCRSFGSGSSLLPEMLPLTSVATGHAREAISALMDAFETQSEMDSIYCISVPYSLASLCVSGYSLLDTCCLQSLNPTSFYLKHYIHGPVNSELV